MTYKPEALPIGGNRLSFKELSSTMDYLKTHAPELPHGTVVVAERQTAGRGRMGRAWQDAPGAGLYLSVLLRPRLEAQQFGLLPLAAGLAVCQGLRELCPGEYQVKWPNDPILNGKKVCGILCETQWGADVFTVLGIGVNLLQDRAYFMKCGLPHATSLYQETGKIITADVALNAICRRLDPLLTELQEKGFSSIKAAYEAACVSIGRRVRVTVGGEEREGDALGVDAQGQLLVQFNDNVQAIRSGEASVRGLYGYV